DRVVRQLRLNDVTNGASMILALTTASLGLALWYFLPLMRACSDHIATAPREELALLSPAFLSLHDHFRETFTLLTLLSVSLWRMLLKFAARHGQTVSRSKLKAGVVVALLAIVILSLPYRLLRHNEFEVASWNGYRCYVTGQRVTTLLLFCPLSPVPRNQI